jgi:hypothetical protein
MQKATNNYVAEATQGSFVFFRRAEHGLTVIEGVRGNLSNSIVPAAQMLARDLAELNVKN